MNPYEATARSAPSAKRHAVRRYIVLSSLFFCAAFMAGYPALEFFNQRWQVIPMQSDILDIEIDGRPVSRTSVMLFIFGTGLVLSIVGLALVAMSFSNWRFNRRTG